MKMHGVLDMPDGCAGSAPRIRAPLAKLRFSAESARLIAIHLAMQRAGLNARRVICVGEVRSTLASNICPTSSALACTTLRYRAATSCLLPCNGEPDVTDSIAGTC